jgi:coenzyme PQQ synthesis protein D (PqqD)
MDLNTVLTKSPDAASRTYDGQATIVLPSRAEVKVLNEVGSRVWDAIDGRRTLGEILESIVSDYDIPRAQLEQDVVAFVGDLREHGMVN